MTVCKNTPRPDLEHQLQRLNGQEAYDAKQTSRIRFYGGAFVTEHASKCPQVITHSLSVPFWEVSSTTLLRHPPCWVPLEASEKSLSCSQLWWNYVKATGSWRRLSKPHFFFGLAWGVSSFLWNESPGFLEASVWGHLQCNGEGALVGSTAGWSLEAKGMARTSLLYISDV